MKLIRKYINKITIASVLLFACLIGIFTITTKASTETTDSGISYEITPPDNEYGTSHINSIGGMSWKYNQLAYDLIPTTSSNGITVTNNNNESLTVNGTATANVYINATIHTYYLQTNHNYFVTGKRFGFYRANPYNLYFNDNEYGIFSMGNATSGIHNYQANIRPQDGQMNYTFYPMIIDLTDMGINTTDVTLVLNELSKRGIDINTYQPYNTGTIRDSFVTSVLCKDSNDNIIDTLNISNDIQSLNGYGWGINNSCYNNIDLINYDFNKKVNKLKLKDLTYVMTTSHYFYVYIGSSSTTMGNELTTNILTNTNYLVTNDSTIFNNNTSLWIPNDSQIFFHNTNYTDVTSFKNQFTDNDYLYYELKNTQQVDISSYIVHNQLNYVSGTTIQFVNEYQQAIPYWIVFYGNPISNLYTSYNTLQQQYDTLLQQYDTLNGQYTGLQNAFTNLENAFNDYISTHSHTNTEWNTLEQNYNNLQNTYQQLQLDYNNLVDNFNRLNLQYDFGIFAYLNEANFVDVTNSNSIYVPNTSNDSWSLDDLRNHNIVGYGGYFNLYVFESSSLNPNYHAISSHLYFNKQNEDLSVSYLPLELFSLKYNNNNGSRVELISSTDVHVIFNLDDYVNGITDVDVTNSNSNFGQYIEEIIITPNNAESMGYYYTNNFYNIGYTNGYSNAYNSYKHYVTENEQLSSQISQLQNELSASNSAYQTLFSSYNNLVNGRSDLPTLFFTIAQTPFETFKTIWNVDFLGVNLAGFFTGIIMLGLMLWIVKKIF